MGQSADNHTQAGPSRGTLAAAGWLRYLIPILMIGLAVHLLLPQIAGLEQSVATLRQMSWWLICLAGLAQLVSYLGSGLELVYLARLSGDRLSIWRGISLTLAANSVGLVAGGIVGNSAATYSWAKGSRLSAASAGLLATVPSLLNNALLLVISIIGVGYLFIVHDLTKLEAVSVGLVFLGLVLIGAIFVWGVGHPVQVAAHGNRVAAALPWRRKKPHDPERLQRVVEQWANTGRIVRHGWHGPLSGAAVNVAMDVLTLFLLFLAAGDRVGFGVLLAGYGLPLMIGKLPLVPGGVGVIEGTMTAIYLSLGVPHDVAVVAILSYRLFSFWIPTLLGFPIAAALQRETAAERVIPGGEHPAA